MTDHALSPKTGHGTAVQISWGLVQIPVRLHIVTDSDRTIPSRSTFVKVGDEFHPVGYKNYDKITDEVLAADAEIVKRANVGDDLWAELTDAEIEEHSTLTPGRAEIMSFVPMADVAAHYVIEKYGTWVPEKMKVGKTKVADPNASKAAQLLRTAMAERDVAALVMVPTRGGGQFVALFADGRLGWLVYAENVRNVPLPEPVELTDAEVAMAGQLIDSIGIDTPVLHDEAGARIREYLVAKAALPEGEKVETVAVAKAPVVVDLMAALAASVEQATAAKPKAKKAKAS